MFVDARDPNFELKNCCGNCKIENIISQLC